MEQRYLWDVCNLYAGSSSDVDVGRVSRPHDKGDWWYVAYNTCDGLRFSLPDIPFLRRCCNVGLPGHVASGRKSASMGGGKRYQQPGMDGCMYLFNFTLLCY